MKKLYLGNEAVARGLYEAGVQVVSAYPKQKNGTILFPFPRFFFTAVR